MSRDFKNLVRRDIMNDPTQITQTVSQTEGMVRNSLSPRSLG